MQAASFAPPDKPSRARTPEGVLAALITAGFEHDASHPVNRTILDTFDGRLHGHGLRLEFHEAAGMDLILRGAGTAPAQAAVRAIPLFAADLPPGPLRSRLAPVLDVRALLPKFCLHARQASAVRRDDAGKTLVRVTLHTWASSAPDAPAPPWMAEISPFEGYPRAAEQAEKLLLSLGLAPCDGDVLDVLASGAGIDLRGFAGSPTVPLQPSEPAAAGFRRVLGNLADTIDATWQGTVDATDPEFLHDLRVAVRRTRSVLSHAKGVLPRDGRDHFRSEFGWLGTVTTPSRDLDVYVIEWPGYVAPLGAAAAELRPVLEHIERRREAEHVMLAETLRSSRYAAVINGWRAWIQAPDAGGAGAKRSAAPLGRLVSGRLADAQNRLLIGGRAIDAASPAEALHELRKDAKKLRYLLECFGGLLPAAPRKSFVQRLKSLQDNLGEYQDTEVHTSQLRTMSGELRGASGVGTDVFLAMGRLTELFDQRRLHARETFAERFAAYDTDATARSLKGLLDAAGKS